jgi:flavin reductase (DIM6/NTAB) family NADH-FMN oxidoreductase RutF
MHRPELSTDPAVRRFALRMIPYGVFVATSYDEESRTLAAQTVHWVTQTSFTPPLLMVALDTRSPLYQVVRASSRIVLHMLGRDDGDEAFAFRQGRVFPEQTPEGHFLNGHPVIGGRGHVPLLLHAIAVIQCHVRGIMEYGDHHPLLAEIIDAEVRLPPQERPDKMILRIDELGETIFYGG